MGSYDFARRYFRNRCFFLFLRLLRCFSSAGSLRMTMDSSYGTWCLTMWVSPFGYLRINGYLLLPAAFRSLSRPSSAPSARASALRPFCLTAPHTHSVACAGFFRNFRFSLVLYLFGYLSVSSMSLPIRQLSLTHSFFGIQFSRYFLRKLCASDPSSGIWTPSRDLLKTYFIESPAATYLPGRLLSKYSRPYGSLPSCSVWVRVLLPYASPPDISSSLTLSDKNS